jgi:hypothetical protein
MIYRISGGVFFLLVALVYLGVTAIPLVIVGIVALVAGISLLAGQ